MEYSGSGPSGVWMLTARPLKQGISAEDGAWSMKSFVKRFVLWSYRKALLTKLVGAGEMKFHVRCDDPRSR